VEVKRITDGQGVTVVYDAVGKDTFEKKLNCLTVRGRLFGFSPLATKDVTGGYGLIMAKERYNCISSIYACTSFQVPSTCGGELYSLLRARLFFKP